MDTNDDICLIHTIIYTNNPDVTMHIMEGTAKDSKGSTTKHGVTLSGTIHWIDYKGINNTLTGVAGHREGKRTGTMTYEYGVGNSCIGSGSSTSGDFSKHISSDNNGFSFYLTINSPSTSGNTATLTVKTSIFD